MEMSRNSFFDHEVKKLDGWIQTSDTSGNHHGNWFRPEPGGSGSSIFIGMEDGQYWLRIRNCLRGKHKTTEDALKAWVTCVENKDYYPVEQ
jgi:hypothetical protein